MTRIHPSNTAASATRSPPRTAFCSSPPSITAASRECSRTPSTSGSRPYGKSVWNQKPAAIVSASPGSIGGALANHQVRQSCVFLNMPVMQHPEAYLGHVGDDSFDADGCLQDGPLKDIIVSLSTAFADWV